MEEAVRKLVEDPVRHANESVALIGELKSLDLAAAGAGRNVAARVDALHGHFERLDRILRAGGLDGADAESKAKLIEWTSGQVKAFQAALRNLCAAGGGQTTAAPRAMAAFALLDSMRLRRSKRFQVENLDAALRAAWSGDCMNEHALERLAHGYLGYADVAFYGLRHVARACASSDLATPTADAADVLHNLFDLLRALTKGVHGILATLPSASDGREGGAPAQADAAPELLFAAPDASAAVDGPSLRHELTQAWLAFLRLPTDLGADAVLLRRVLLFLPDAVLPHITTPVLLSDFFSRCVDHQGEFS